jgi:hypothetical protein
MDMKQELNQYLLKRFEDLFLIDNLPTINESINKSNNESNYTNDIADKKVNGGSSSFLSHTEANIIQIENGWFNLLNSLCGNIENYRNICEQRLISTSFLKNNSASNQVENNLTKDEMNIVMENDINNINANNINTNNTNNSDNSNMSNNSDTSDSNNNTDNMVLPKNNIKKINILYFLNEAKPLLAKITKLIKKKKKKKHILFTNSFTNYSIEATILEKYKVKNNISYRNDSLINNKADFHKRMESNIKQSSSLSHNSLSLEKTVLIDYSMPKIGGLNNSYDGSNINYINTNTKNSSNNSINAIADSIINSNSKSLTIEEKIKNQIEKENHLKTINELRAFKIIQVKENCGLLEIDYIGGDIVIKELINLANSFSANVCEVCGRPGIMQMSGQWKTRCARHNKNDKNILEKSTENTAMSGVMRGSNIGILLNKKIEVVKIQEIITQNEVIAARVISLLLRISNIIKLKE